MQLTMARYALRRVLVTVALCASACDPAPAPPMERPADGEAYFHRQAKRRPRGP